MPAPTMATDESGIMDCSAPGRICRPIPADPNRRHVPRRGRAESARQEPAADLPAQNRAARRAEWWVSCRHSRRSTERESPPEPHWLSTSSAVFRFPAPSHPRVAAAASTADTPSPPERSAIRTRRIGSHANAIRHLARDTTRDDGVARGGIRWGPSLLLSRGRHIRMLAEHPPQPATDFAGGCIRLHGSDRGRDDVFRRARDGLEIVECLCNAGLIAFLAQLHQVGNLALGNQRVGAIGLRGRRLAAGVAVDAYDDSLSGFDLALILTCAPSDFGLDPAGLDGMHHATALLDLCQVCIRAAFDLVSQ